MQKIFFAIISLLIIYILCEVLSYQWIKRYSVTGFYGARPVDEGFHPYLGWKHPPNQKLGTMMSDDKGRSITPSKNQTGPIIVFTGGSAIFGIGQESNDKTIATLVSDALDMKGVNLSSRAYRSFQEMLVLRDYFLYEKADIVVAITGQIDPMYANSEPDEPLLPKDVWAKAAFVNRAEEELPILQHVDGYLRQYSYSIDVFCRLVRKFLRPKPIQYIPQKRYELIPEQAKRTIDHYYMMKSLCDRNNARFYVILQPIRTDRTFLKMYYDEVVKQGCDIITLNLRDLLPDEDFIDSAHYTALGAKKVADRITETIKPDRRG